MTAADGQKRTSTGLDKTICDAIWRTAAGENVSVLVTENKNIELSVAADHILSTFFATLCAA